MIYFSEVKNKKVYTEDGLYLGKISDLIFRYTDIPRITKILLIPNSEISKEKIYIAFEHIKRFNGSVIVAKNYTQDELSENELFVNRNLIDKQIIDFSGSKVVRVNDIVMQNRDDGSFIIVGADIGFLGIVRWFGFATLAEQIHYMIFNRPIKRTVLSWSNVQPLEIAQGKIQLNVEQNKLEKLRPEDLADYLEATNIKNVANIINMLDREFASEVVAELNINYQIALLKKLPLDQTIKLISLMDPDEAVDVLLEFNPKRQEAILSELSPVLRKKVQRLLNYSDSSVGKYVTTDFITVNSSQIASNVMRQIRKESGDISLDYIYVINDQNELTGVFSLHELVLQKFDTPVYKFMNQNLVVTHLKSSLIGVMRKLIKYKLSSLPVVDDDKQIIGVVVVGDIGEVFFKEI